MVVNRVFLFEAGHYLRSWQDIQAKYLREIEEGFSPLPILKSSFREVEMVGIERLREMARELYGDRDPSEVFVVERPVRLSQHNGGYCLSIHLPTADEKALDISMYKHELIIRLGSYRRNVVLPRAVADKKLVKAEFEGKRLNVIFGGEKDGEGRRR